MLQGTDYQASSQMAPMKAAPVETKAPMQQILSTNGTILEKPVNPNSAIKKGGKRTKKVKRAKKAKKSKRRMTRK